MKLKQYTVISGVVETLAVLAIAAFATIAGARLMVPAQAQQQPGPSAGDLHQLALKAGGAALVHFTPDRSVLYPNLEELARRSDIVIIGRPVQGGGILRQDGQFINEQFWVGVQESIKGGFHNGDRIPVVVPGGAYRFSDGSLALVNASGGKRPECGRSYAFFLYGYGLENKGYELVGGLQGVYDLTGPTVQPGEMLPQAPCVVYYKDMPANAFLAALHRAMGNNQH